MISSKTTFSRSPYLALIAGGIGFLLVLIGAILAVVDVFGTNENVILRLGYGYRVEATGSILELGLFGLLLVLIFGINILLVYELEKRDWLWGKVVALATLLMGILIFIGFQGIISVN